MSGSAPKYQAEADKFIAENGKDKNEAWHEKTTEMRGQIDPALFEYSERLSRGEQPPEEDDRWPRSEAKQKRDEEIFEEKIDVRSGGDPIFSAIDYNSDPNQRMQSTARDNDVGPVNESKAEGGWQDGEGPLWENVPRGVPVIEPQDQRVPLIDYQPVDPATAAEMIDAEPWRERQESEERADLFPTQNPKPVRRSRKRWSDKRKKLLIRTVWNGKAVDWEEAGRRIGQVVTECQEKYRELADLPHDDSRSGEKWEKQEEESLRRFRDEYGCKDWIRISHFMKRTVGACQSRYTKSTKKPLPSSEKTPVTRRTAQSRYVPRPGGYETRGKKRRREAGEDDDDRPPKTKRPTKAKRPSSSKTNGSIKTKKNGQKLTGKRIPKDTEHRERHQPPAIDDPGTSRKRGRDDIDEDGLADGPQKKTRRKRPSRKTPAGSGSVSFADKGDETNDIEDDSNQQKRPRLMPLGPREPDGSRSEESPQG